MAEAMATTEDTLTEAAEAVAVTTEAVMDTCLEVATRLTLGTNSLIMVTITKLLPSLYIRRLHHQSLSSMA